MGWLGAGAPAAAGFGNLGVVRTGAPDRRREIRLRRRQTIGVNRASVFRPRSVELHYARLGALYGCRIDGRCGLECRSVQRLSCRRRVAIHFRISLIPARVLLWGTFDQRFRTGLWLVFDSIWPLQAMEHHG